MVFSSSDLPTFPSGPQSVDDVTYSGNPYEMAEFMSKQLAQIYSDPNYIKEKLAKTKSLKEFYIKSS